MSSIKSFTQDRFSGLISEAVKYLDLPDGCDVRQAFFADDLVKIGKLTLSDSDTIHPCYGMSPPDSPDELTLIVEVDGVVSGQASSSMIAEIENDTLVVDVSVSGIFISQDCRGKGLSSGLADGMLEVVHAWSKYLSEEEGLSFEEVDVTVSGDTLPGTIGEYLIEKMQSRANPDDGPSLST